MHALKKYSIVSQSYELVPLADIRPHLQNPRRGDVGVIEESIQENGFYGACIVQKTTGLILAGEHRWHAARSKGATEIPVLFVDVDDETATRILLVDNRANDLAGYDQQALSDLLEEVSQNVTGLLGTGWQAEEEEEEEAGEVKEWDASELTLRSIFTFSAPIEMQGKIREVLRREFPEVSFEEQVLVR